MQKQGEGTAQDRVITIGQTNIALRVFLGVSLLIFLFIDVFSWGDYLSEWKEYKAAKPIKAKIEKFWTETPTDSFQEYWIKVDYVDEKGVHKKTDLKESPAIWHDQKPGEELVARIKDGKLSIESPKVYEILDFKLTLASCFFLLFYYFGCFEKQKSRVYSDVVSHKKICASADSCEIILGVISWILWLGFTLLTVWVFSERAQDEIMSCRKVGSGKVERIWNAYDGTTDVMYSYSDEGKLRYYVNTLRKSAQAVPLKPIVGAELPIRYYPSASSGILCSVVSSVFRESYISRQYKNDKDDSEKKKGVLIISFSYFLFSAILLYSWVSRRRAKKNKKELRRGIQVTGNIKRAGKVNPRTCSLIYEFEDNSGVKRTGETRFVPVSLASQLAVNAVTKVWYDPNNPEKSICEIG